NLGDGLEPRSLQGAASVDDRRSGSLRDPYLGHLPAGVGDLLAVLIGVKVRDSAAPDVDQVEAFVLVRLAGLRASVGEPLDAHGHIPGRARNDHLPDLETQLVIQSEEPLEPGPHCVAAVALAAKGRLAGE